MFKYSEVLWKSVSKKEGKHVEGGGETRDAVWIRDRQAVELQRQQMKMLRVSVGVMRMDRIKKESIRGTAHAGCFGGKVREFRGGTEGC